MEWLRGLRILQNRRYNVLGGWSHCTVSRDTSIIKSLHCFYFWRTVSFSKKLLLDLFVRRHLKNWLPSLLSLSFARNGLWSLSLKFQQCEWLLHWFLAINTSFLRIVYKLVYKPPVSCLSSFLIPILLHTISVGIICCRCPCNIVSLPQTTKHLYKLKSNLFKCTTFTKQRMNKSRTISPFSVM